MKVRARVGVCVAVLVAAGSLLAVGSAPASAAPGETWVPQTAAAANPWSSVTYGNGLFVAVASDGTNRVMTSPDGKTWTARTAPEANFWNSVTYGNGLFVAVARGLSGNQQAMTSPDGITWTARTTPLANFWQSVTYGNGLFVAVAYGGPQRVMTSPDGITWTVRTGPNGNWLAVTYGGGLFVAVGAASPRVMTSPDGISWTARTAVANEWASVAYGEGLFVAVTSSGGPNNRVMTSPDAITWTTHPGTEVNAWQSVTYGDGLFVAVSSNGTHRVMLTDVQAPVIAQRAAVYATATGAGGAVVTYTPPGTTDNEDPPGVADCLPTSGSTFSVGQTTVTCNATDTFGNEAVPTAFTVTVAPAPPQILPNFTG